MRGQGKVEGQHGGPVRSARRRANDLENGSQLGKRASDRSRPDNECDMCSEKAARVQLRLAVVGGSS
jgi:hypothetical protein